MAKILVKVMKAQQSLEVDTDKITEAAYKAALAKGLEYLINRKMLKFCIVDVTDAQLKHVQQGAMKQAKANLKDLEA